MKAQCLQIGSALISVLYKKGSRNKVENYRPVSLTSEICKLFEVIIREGMVHYHELLMN